jgi:hypothetical protein
MTRITVKTSTVFVSVGHETRVFRSVDEVPPEWRKRFERPKGGLKPQTILIADRKGREEILKSLQGQPSSVKTRWRASSGAPPLAAAPGTMAPASNEPALPLEDTPVVPDRWSARQIWIEAGFVILVACAVWIAFAR